MFVNAFSSMNAVLNHKQFTGYRHHLKLQIEIRNFKLDPGVSDMKIEKTKKVAFKCFSLFEHHGYV